MRRTSLRAVGFAGAVLALGVAVLAAGGAGPVRRAGASSAEGPAAAGAGSAPAALAVGGAAGGAGSPAAGEGPSAGPGSPPAGAGGAAGVPSAADAAWRLQWSWSLPPRRPAWECTPRMPRDLAYEPALCGGLVLVGCEHNGAVLALDAATGDERWRFYTSGPVRFAPVGDGERIYAVSDDGRLYCLDPSGRLLWQFRGGPSERKILAHDRVGSAWPGSVRPALAGGKVFFVAGYWPTEGVFVYALDARTGEVAWFNDTSAFRPFGRARVLGDTLFVDGHRGSGAFDVRTGAAVSEKPPAPEPPSPAPAPGGVEGTVAAWLEEGGRLLVATAEGRLYDFARTEAVPRRHEVPAAEAGERSALAADVLRAAGATEGYAFVLGLRDGALVEGLVRGSRMHVVGVDADAAKVEAVRRRLDRRGLFGGHRLSVWTGDPSAFGLPPYVASLIVSETGVKPGEAARESLRPYGGALVDLADGRPRATRRDGPLPGAADWTHEFADEANSLASADTRVRAPLGLVWYGGRAADPRYYFNGEVDHQSGDGVSPLPPNALVAGGRLILQGPGLLGAFDIYTGTLLWEAPLPRMYVFGGKGGGLGIHSKNHPEPWRHPEAMAMEVPPVHQCRASGFNYACAADAVYVAAGRQCLRLDPADGKRLSAWLVPGAGDWCWGNLRVAGDLLVATAFHPQDVADAQAGHDGNGGDWAKDRLAMARLLVLDRQAGRLLWSREAAWGFLNQGMAVGGGRVYAVDLAAETVLAKFREAGRRMPDLPPMLYAFDARTGAEIWKYTTDVLVKQLTYSRERDLLVAPARTMTVWRDGAWVEEKPAARGKAAGRMRAFRGADGTPVYEVADAPYYEPHIAVHDLLIDRNGWPYDLRTGKAAERPSPLTGQAGPWNFKKGGCNHLVAGEHLVTWRTAFYDLAGGSGTMALTGMDAGCSPTFLPAGGVLTGPNFGTHYKRNRMTALALAPMAEAQVWTKYEAPPPAQPTPMVRAGFNLGAPGDRLAEDGTLWLAVSGPKRTGGATVEPADAAYFQYHPLRSGCWIASSGVVGAARIALPTVLGPAKKKGPAAAVAARRFDLRLVFAEPEDVRAGQRVFSVRLGDRTLLKDLDVVKEAGGRLRPLVREVKGIEAGEAIVLDLVPSAGSMPAVLSGAAVVAEGGRP